MTQIRDRITRAGGGLLHTCGPWQASAFAEQQVELLSIVPWGPDGLRVRVTVGPRILDTAWALTEPVAGGGVAEVTVGDTEATVRNGRISARLSGVARGRATARLEFFRHPGGDDSSEAEPVPILAEHDYVVGCHDPGARIFQPRTGAGEEGLYNTEHHFAARPGERLYGMGLNATGSLDLKGCVIDLYQRHCKHVVPFLVSSEGYGLLWNNPSLGRVEFGNNMTRWVSRGCRQLDYYVNAGDNCADIMGNYAGVTGHAPMLPEWAAGFWMCKLRYRTQKEFLAAAREFRRLGLPLSVLVIDYRHWRHWGDWQLDPEFWPDPPAMVREIDDMGARIMISPWVMVEESSDNFAELHRRGLYVKGPGGAEAWWPADPPAAKPGHPADRPRGRSLQYDPTHPEAAQFLWQRWKRNYVDLGIKTFWLDPCDDLSHIADYDKVHYHAGPGVEANCFYPVAHQKTVHDGLHAAGEPEVVTICRSSWAGSQRYGASPAAHDIASSFAHLREYLMAGLNLAMAGIPWGAAEIGGFVTPAEQDDEFRELVVRWYQYGVFTPIFRTHGHRANNEPWNIGGDGGDGGDTYRHIRAAIMLRERLRPYVLAQMKVASERGIPPMRPLFFDFPDDQQAAAVEDQFLFGPDLLVAPITEYRGRERRVYLPAGTDWTDAWNGDRVHAGGETIDADAPLERIPVFIRGQNRALAELFPGLYDL